MTHPFDRDTALEPVAAGRWRASVSEGWFVEQGPNGGFVAALAARALTQTAGADRPPRSLTLHFLRAPVAGELAVACEVEREGRSTTFQSLRFEQDGATVALGLGCCAAWREGQPEWNDTEAPEVASPEECERIPHGIPGNPRFLVNYEMRPAFGEATPGPARTGGWIRLAEARGLDPVLLAALTDAWVPSAFLRMPEPSFVPTLDLTVHWRAPLDAGAGGHPWVLGAFTTRLAAGGVWEEDGELWSADGVLLAQSRQLAVVRAARR